MILIVSFSSVEDALFKDVRKYYTCRSQVLKIHRSAFFFDTRYKQGFLSTRMGIETLVPTVVGILKLTTLIFQQD